MAFCKNCGTQIQEGKKFCGTCGQAITAEAASGPQHQQSQYRQGEQQSENHQGFRQGTERVAQFAQNTADETAGIDPADIQKNKAMGGLAYLLFFLPLIACPDSKYGRFHANQALLYLITCVGGGIVIGVLSVIIGMLSWGLLFISTILSVVFWIAVMVLGIMGLINGFSGKAKELPIIGKFRIIK